MSFYRRIGDNAFIGEHERVSINEQERYGLYRRAGGWVFIGELEAMPS